LFILRRYHINRRKEFEKVVDYKHLLSLKKEEEPPTPAPTTPAPTNETIEKEKKAALTYERYRLKSEIRQRNLQDLDQEKYRIRHAPPKCQNSRASVVQQVEDKCIVEEPLDGIEVRANQHSYRFTQLEPETFYRITVRACVEGVVNGCSTPAEYLIKTGSLGYEPYIQGV